MRAWGQRPLVLVRPGEAALDATLAARGYVLRDASLILAAPAAEIADAGPPLTAIGCDGPLAAMAAIWAAGGIGPARLAVMARAAGPRTWLLGRLDDAAAGCAFVAAADGVAMLHALEVAPEARRRGLGAVLTRAAAAWATGARRRDAGAGGHRSATRRRARSTRGLGMTEAARYHYRLAPQED